jgi:hypothetical protein
MMKKIRTLILGLAIAIFAAAPLAIVAAPTTTFAAAPTQPSDCEYRILLMPTWFRGLVVVDNGDCRIISPGEADPNGSGTIDLAGFIWRIALNVIEIGLFIAGYAALFFIIYGGFQFLTGGSNPGQIEKARTTILNAVIGFVISIAAIGITNLIFGIIG